MKYLAVFLLFTVTTSSCSNKDALSGSIKNNTTSANNPNDLDSIHYLALGDSYTTGQSVDQAQSFPYQLTEDLTQNGYRIGPPSIIATTGWTTDALIYGIAKVAPSNDYDFVTLLIGVNDEFDNLSQDNYRVKFAQVLTTAISLAKGDSSRVFVFSIPDWGVTPFAQGQDSVIGPKIDQFNKINSSISLNAGVHYVDITAISKEAANNPLLIASDGLHPSGAMYQLWVEQLAPLVIDRLRKNEHN